MSVDEAIANLYPDAALVLPSAIVFPTDDQWVSPARFLPVFQYKGPHREHAAQKPKEIQTQHHCSFARPQAETFDCPMDTFPGFAESLNCETTAANAATTSNRSDANLVVVSGLTLQQPGCTEEAAQKKEADSCSSTPALSVSEAHRSLSPHSEVGSDGKGDKRPARPWTKDEHAKFVAALEKFRTNKTEKVKRNGKQTSGLGPGIADVIALIVQTRDAAQVRSHAQKYFQRLRRESKGQGNSSD